MLKILNKIKIWWLTRQFDKEAKENIEHWFQPRPNISVKEVDKELKYATAIAILKENIRKQALHSSLEEVLKKNGDKLLELAYNKNSDVEDMRAIFESVYIYSGQDIKTDEDRKKMIDRRIADYMELRKAKAGRELLRKARAAYKAGDLTTHNNYMEEWKNKYG